MTLHGGKRPQRSSSAEETVSSADEDLWGRNILGFTLSIAYFAHIIDFRSYVDATMSLYSIII